MKILFAASIPAQINIYIMLLGYYPMANKFSSILNKEISKIKPGGGETEEIEKETGKIISELEKNLKKRKINAEVFIGGSMAKGTMIKKKNYDADIFVRFDKKYDNSEISEMLSKIARGSRVHGSRDYFQIKKGNILFEIIPVLKISKPAEANNVTDLSYFHVKYVLGEAKKNRNLSDEIMLAKAFCHGQKAYGAESYIKGFSGYALELLVIHYKSFINFLKAAGKSKEQIVIDSAKFYKNKQDVLDNLNEAKLSSPIVFVDPTFKERNALAALSKETFEKFRESAKKFLRNPSLKFFEEEKINEKNFNFILEFETDRQEGDIAGSKMLKFSRFVEWKLKKYFDILGKNFLYEGSKKAKSYFKVKAKKKIILNGPPINKPERLLAFKSAHKKVFIRKHIAYAEEKSINLNEFFGKLKSEKQVMKDMGIISLKVMKK